VHEGKVGLGDKIPAGRRVPSGKQVVEEIMAVERSALRGCVAQCIVVAHHQAIGRLAVNVDAEHHMVVFPERHGERIARPAREFPLFIRGGERKRGAQQGTGLIVAAHRAGTQEVVDRPGRFDPDRTLKVPAVEPESFVNPETQRQFMKVIDPFGCFIACQQLRLIAEPDVGGGPRPSVFVLNVEVEHVHPHLVDVRRIALELVCVRRGNRPPDVPNIIDVNVSLYRQPLDEIPFFPLLSLVQQRVNRLTSQGAITEKQRERTRRNLDDENDLLYRFHKLIFRLKNSKLLQIVEFYPDNDWSYSSFHFLCISKVIKKYHKKCDERTIDRHEKYYPCYLFAVF